MAAISPEFLPLANLTAMSKGPPAYFALGIDSSDEIIRVGAWCGLMDAYAIVSSQHERLLRDCCYAAVRQRAFNYFESIYEHDLAARAAAATPPSIDDARHAMMMARLNESPAAAALGEAASYLATGTGGHLLAASWQAEFAGGWRDGLVWAVRGFAAQPQNAELMLKLFNLLDNSRQDRLLDQLADLLASAQVYAGIVEITRALAARTRGDGPGCIARLDKIDAHPEVANTLGPFKGLMKKMRAEALDQVGDYKRAYQSFVELNAADAGEARVDASLFYKGAEARARLPIPPLPPDPRTNCLQMLGFPRSGTTLLENALAAHPLIETFEEIPALQAATDLIERVLLKKLPRPAADADIYIAARERYYAELARRRKKPAAKVLIDKLPIRSSEARYLKRLFPDQRSIFSIRHPYDVVLSCFRQRFSANPAMANFYKIGDAARAYDFAMQQWFAVHSMDDPLVHYVRYDKLVEDFRSVMEGLLAFLGLDWHDEVLSFAEKSDSRGAKTPSYPKVRQGLSLGVQSHWRNYAFVFQSEGAKPLHRWAKFFGYETL